MVWLWAAVASAGVPDDVRPVLVADGAPERYAEWRAGRGLPARALECADAGPPGILVCFRTGGPSGPRWVHRADLVAWGTTVVGLRAEMIRRAPSKLVGEAWVPVLGTGARYLRVTDDDGWAAAAILAPRMLALRIGASPVRVSIPAQGVVVAYAASTPELDRIMAVGVRELYDTLPRKVTPMLYDWDRGAWRTYGSAVAR